MELVQLELVLVDHVRPQGTEHPVEDEQGHVRAEAADVLQERVAQDGSDRPKPTKSRWKVVQDDRAMLGGDSDVIEIENGKEPFFEVLSQLRRLLEADPPGEGHLLLRHDGLHLRPDPERIWVGFLRAEGGFQSVVLQFVGARIEVDVNESEWRPDRVGHVHIPTVRQELAAHVSEFRLDKHLVRQRGTPQEEQVELG